MKERLVDLLITIIILLALGFAAGYQFANDQLEDLRTEYDKAVADAKQALIDANKRTKATEEKWKLKTTALTAQYDEKERHEKVATDRVIADLRADVTRLRVSTQPARRGELPNPAAGGGQCDATEERTLTGSVAARLAGRYADYNSIVRQLTTCQGILAAERE